jgi:anti-sigma regulatory factor (Ser/Thr protein kinase)
VILTATVAPDLANGVIMVELHGVLSVQSAPTARAVLLKCLVQGPDAVIVDVADLKVEQRSHLTVFPAAVRSHGGPHTALLLCGASEQLSRSMRGGVLGGVRTYADRDLALAAAAAARGTGARRTALRLGPTPSAPTRARQFVTDTCRDWDLDDLRGPATLVASELVSNAVQHAGTDMVIRVAHRGDHLHLSVSDGSRTPPRVPGTRSNGVLTDRGRGLHLVSVYTSAWGSNVSADGKTVWATMRATPLR